MKNNCEADKSTHYLKKRHNYELCRSETETKR